MSVAEALGRSCNPVFGHLGLQYLNAHILQKYSRRFGFNRPLELEAPLSSSAAEIPLDSDFELSRTAAGFGRVSISPIHAVTLMAGVANGGLLPRPHIVEQIVAPDGKVLDRTKPDVLNRIVQPTTAASLLEMMRYTTTIGTSRREFMRGSRPTLGGIDVVGKTGTLKGDNPMGLNNWFIGSAPLNNPELALAVVTVDARHSSKASRLARMVFEKFFNVDPTPEPAAVAPRRFHPGSKYKRGHAAAKRVSSVKRAARPALKHSKGKTATASVKSGTKKVALKKHNKGKAPAKG